MGRVPTCPAFLPASGIEDQSLPWGRRISSSTKRAGNCTQRRINSCRPFRSAPHPPPSGSFEGTNRTLLPTLFFCYVWQQ